MAKLYVRTSGSIAARCKLILSGARIASELRRELIVYHDPLPAVWQELFSYPLTTVEIDALPDLSGDPDSRMVAVPGPEEPILLAGRRFKVLVDEPLLDDCTKMLRGTPEHAVAVELQRFMHVIQPAGRHYREADDFALANDLNKGQWLGLHINGLVYQRSAVERQLHCAVPQLKAGHFYGAFVVVEQAITEARIREVLEAASIRFVIRTRTFDDAKDLAKVVVPDLINLSRCREILGQPQSNFDTLAWWLSHFRARLTKLQPPK